MTSTDRYRLTERLLPTGEEPVTGDDDAEADLAEIRYSLTSLGETALAEGGRRGRGPRFRGFGPCGAMA